MREEEKHELDWLMINKHKNEFYLKNLKLIIYKPKLRGELFLEGITISLGYAGAATIFDF